ncbi:MAG: hypothetical protein EXR77_00965 [Myxococcales bacterium]|nr:hypothetical protein [Myxococcales bacterium]
MVPTYRTVCGRRAMSQILLAQAAGNDAAIASGLRGLNIPANCKNYIIAAGEPHTIDGANIITFKDDPSWDFERLNGPEGNLVDGRRIPGKVDIVKTVAEAQDVVKGVLIHADITPDARMCFNVLKSRTLSTHFMIDWNGVIYQGTDAIREAAHGGGKENTLKDANHWTIGIDMNCMLVKMTGDGKPSGSQGDRRVFEATINGEPWRSIGYTDAQYDALVKLLRGLKQLFSKIVLMPPIGPDKQVLMEQTEIDLEKCGIFGHFHLNAQKIDPGPGFEWTRLIADLNRQANSFPVILERAKDGKPKNIDTVYAESEVRKLAEAYFRNIEDPNDGAIGGTFPIGSNGQWHGGIHLHLPAGSPVMAMFAGRVVAAKSSMPGEPEPAFGSNNFVVLKHEIAVDDTDPASRKFRFWSLYMHLLPFDSSVDHTEAMAQLKNEKLDEDERNRIAPDWVHQLRNKLAGKKAEEEAAELAAAAEEFKKAEKEAQKAIKEAQKAEKQAAKGKAKGKAGDKDGKKKKKKTDGDDEDGEQVKDDDEMLFLETGKNLDALQDGRLALIEEKYPVDVKVGERIGRVGQFGDSPDSQTSVVHIEVFADGNWKEFVDLLGSHAQSWYESNPDPSDDVMCDDEELLRTVLPEESSRRGRKMRNFLDAGMRISGDQIVDFFKSMPADNPAVDRIRKGITFHISEWSDQVDWFKSLSKAQDWAGRSKDIETLLKDSQHGWSNRLFAGQIRRQLPYIWLNQEVAMHIGLDNAKGNWDGHLFHFHPINFLLWLTFRFGTNKMARPTASRLDEAKQKLYRKAQEKEEAEQREKGQLEFGQDIMPGAGGDLEPPEDVLKDLWEAPRLPNEWKLRETP